MTPNEMKQLQSIYSQLGSIASSISINDGEGNSNYARSKKCLDEARDCIMDAVMINIEDAFDKGMLFISNYQ